MPSRHWVKTLPSCCRPGTGLRRWRSLFDGGASRANLDFVVVPKTGETLTEEEDALLYIVF